MARKKSVSSKSDLNVQTVPEEDPEMAEALASDDDEDEDNSFDDEDEEELDLSDSDEEDDGEESQEQERPVDGRKTRTPRQIYFVCSAIVGKNLVSDQMEISEKGADADVVAGKAEVEGRFTEQYGKAPEKVYGPFFERKGVSYKPPLKKRETISIRVARRKPFNAEYGTAIYNFKGHDWKVMVNYTIDPDVVMIVPTELAHPEEKKSKEKIVRPPNANWVNPNTLKNVQKATSTNS